LEQDLSIQVEINDRAILKLLIDIDQAGRGVKDRVADVYTASGPMFVRTMKQVVRKDTRALERSLSHTVNRKFPRLRFGSIKKSINPKSGRPASTYAPHVHDGTARMTPNPFTRIAFNRHTTPQGAFMRGMRRAGIGNIGKSTGGGRI
jgi:hypothetical protein